MRNHDRHGFILSLVRALALAASPVAAANVLVDVMINGQRVQRGGLVHGDRTYVKLVTVAWVLKGRYLYDRKLNVAFVLTGHYRNLVADRISALNPQIAPYRPEARFEPGRGIRYGVPDPHIGLDITPSGLLAAVEMVYPRDDFARQPWFDRQASKARQRRMGRRGYTQHLYTINPRLIRLGNRTRIAFNGMPVNVPAAAIFWDGDTLWVRLRDVAENSGGGVGWDDEARVASAKILSGPDLTWATLGEFNKRSIIYYEERSSFVPHIGYWYGPDGPGVLVALDGEDSLTAFGTLFAASKTPWFPWFDQKPKMPEPLPGIGKAYSQHIRLVESENVNR